MGGRGLRREPFNLAGRENLLQDLPDRYDLVVVGAGINGCGIAFEAARRGYSVLLLDQGDVGGGTSSRSSRLIHGGLRYLQRGRLRLVREASRERSWLRSRYPHLVKPIRFLIPFYRGERPGPLVTRLGLWLYRLLSGDTEVAPSDRLTAATVVASEPRLRREGLRGGAFYSDCWTDDFRLVLLNAKRAHEMGAQVLTYARVEGLLRENGKVHGVAFRDRLAGGRYQVRADLVINATGPWSDELRALVARPGRLRHTKGVHVFLRKTQVGNLNAVVMRSPRDGRFVFALPWRDLSLVGTTDTDYEGPPEAVRPRAEDVNYLLEAVNHHFPLAKAGPDDVLSSYAALRPLIGRRGIPGSKVSRGERIDWDAPGLLSLIGGKLTTYRSVAQKVMRKATRVLPSRREEGARLGEAASGRASPPVGDWGTEAGEAFGLSPETIEHLMASHGPEVRQLYPYLEEEDLAKPLLPDLPYLRGEVVYAVRHELAARLEDVLVRRTRVAYEDPNHGLGIAGEVARLMAATLGWDASRVAEEVERYEAVIAANEAFRGEA